MSFELPIIVAVIIAFSEFLKKKTEIPPKVIPVVTLVLGLAGGFFFVPGANVQETVFIGLIIGLSSMGLFDLTKVTRKSTKK